MGDCPIGWFPPCASLKKCGGEDTAKCHLPLTRVEMFFMCVVFNPIFFGAVLNNICILFYILLVNMGAFDCLKRREYFILFA